MIQRLALWHLRRFRAFRELEEWAGALEHRLTQLCALHLRKGAPAGSLARVENEVERALLVHCPVYCSVRVSSEITSDLGPGEVHTIIRYGGGHHG